MVVEINVNGVNSIVKGKYLQYWFKSMLVKQIHLKKKVVHQRL